MLHEQHTMTDDNGGGVPRHASREIAQLRLAVEEGTLSVEQANRGIGHIREKAALGFYDGEVGDDE